MGSALAWGLPAAAGVALLGVGEVFGAVGAAGAAVGEAAVGVVRKTDPPDPLEPLCGAGPHA